MKFIAPSLVLLVIAGITGCKTQGPVALPPTNLSYAQQENLVTFEQPRQKLIRVAQFVDKRPKTERIGQIPRSWFMLLGYWRIGTYMTPDSVWISDKGQDLGGTFGQTAKTCLDKTHFFNEVKAENSPDPSGGSGLILKADINSFYGSQNITYYGYFLLYFKTKQEKLTPVGYCKITYQLIDAETNQVLKSNAVESTVREAKLNIVQAGEKALQKAQTLLANEVTTRALLDF